MKIEVTLFSQGSHDGFHLSADVHNEKNTHTAAHTHRYFEYSSNDLRLYCTWTLFQNASGKIFSWKNKTKNKH